MNARERRNRNLWRAPHNQKGYAKDLLKLHEIAIDHGDIIDVNGKLKVGMVGNDIISDLSPYGEENRND